MKSKHSPVAMAYAAILAVVLIWGVIPAFKKALIGGHYSAAVYTAMTTLGGALALLVLSAKRLKNLNATYFKIAIPTGLCVAAASLVQAIAYNFDASPTKQAFLENLSCIVVPLLMLLLVKKKPSMLTVAAALVCLVSSFILGDMLSVGFSFSIADILNALAGVFYGINIAFTGIYAKKLDAKLYVMLQLFVQAISSALMALLFHFVPIGGTPIDPFVFTPNFLLILGVFALGILTNAVCWTLRTSAMKFVSPSVVAVIMPFSAVVTGVVAVILGMDTISWTLIVGAILGLAAALMSSFGDLAESKKES
ncbi:MAG: EamA family transporter [Clostridia bacterium]|nr:EamA family transporter [Clostridia bacterium]